VFDQKPKVVDEIGPIAPKPPADPNRPVRRPGSRQRLHHQHSIDSPTDGSTDRQLRSKSGSLTDGNVMGFPFLVLCYFFALLREAMIPSAISSEMVTITVSA